MSLTRVHRVIERSPGAPAATPWRKAPSRRSPSGRMRLLPDAEELPVPRARAPVAITLRAMNVRRSMRAPGMRASSGTHRARGVNGA